MRCNLSNDATYAEVMRETFGTRVIGLQISRAGDGMTAERRPVGAGSMLIYTVGRSHLLELFHSELQSHLVRMVDDPNSRRACEQLMNLDTELRESGIVYKCLPGQHDDLGISCAIRTSHDRRIPSDRCCGRLDSCCRRWPAPRQDGRVALLETLGGGPDIPTATRSWPMSSRFSYRALRQATSW
jgi:hypothetical protein